MTAPDLVLIEDHLTTPWPAAGAAITHRSVCEDARMAPKDLWCKNGLMPLWKKYFQVSKPAKPDAVTLTLWNDEEVAKAYYAEFGAYQSAIMEQYKLYVEMADRISIRRGLANTFFLTLHSAVLTLFAVFWKDPPLGVSSWLLLPVLVLALGLCLAWFWLVRSYRQLNSGKFAVIGALEMRLPASPWWNGEWKALRGEKQDKSTYWAMTHLEIWVPLLFGLAYVFGVVAAVATNG
ncbi:RipA family octameric membrane protein [Ornithinimicrobium sediminis]|uniref:RipA family octameric membrane protein n=1 Tax=Ornithinimicrobium sediminis TaxID=2904603 RepID=UPI001E546DAD|nr:hypothetical protein [Ornithinimicrobium sediminis]MCE0485424.1 hypothetical protein [Ornithinimicrobium sediminis]